MVRRAFRATDPNAHEVWSICQYRCGRLHPGVAQTVTATLAPLELGTSITGAVAASAAGWRWRWWPWGLHRRWRRRWRWLRTGGGGGRPLAGCGVVRRVGQGSSHEVLLGDGRAVRLVLVLVSTQFRTVRLIRAPAAFACGSAGATVPRLSARSRSSTMTVGPGPGAAWHGGCVPRLRTPQHRTGCMLCCGAARSTAGTGSNTTTTRLVSP